MAEPQFEVSDGKGGLKIESLRKSYRKRLVISDVSMHLHRGEVVALLGAKWLGENHLFLLHRWVGHARGRTGKH
jgi:lipopolysaccharide export system ATP-binding protein